MDDFALQPMDQTETADFYELIVERHHKTATVVTSNRDPSEWIALMSDLLLAQSAVDRTDAGNDPTTPPQTARPIDQHGRTGEHHQTTLVVPRSWQPGGPITLADDNAQQPR